MYIHGNGAEGDGLSEPWMGSSAVVLVIFGHRLLHLRPVVDCMFASVGVHGRKAIERWVSSTHSHCRIVSLMRNYQVVI